MSSRSYVVIVILLLVAILVVGSYVHWKLGGERLNDWGNFLAGAGAFILAFAAIWTGRQALQEYKARRVNEETRWLTELFQHFYEDKRYHAIRQRIDYEDLSGLLALIEKDKQEKPQFEPEERDLFDKFTDYLNFFEYIAHLSEKNILNREQIRVMFDYYLERMATVDKSGKLLEYVKTNGFETLYKLLEDYRKGRVAQA